MNDPTATLTFVTACATGVVGGVFFAFSTFVMAGLVRLPAVQGLTAMQSVNVTAVTVPFMTLLFGTALLCTATSVGAVWDWQRPGAGLRLAGGVVYLMGVIGMTIAFHVPRNDALAALDPTHADSAAAWVAYAKVWTLGNHARTASCVVAMALLLLGWPAPRPE